MVHGYWTNTAGWKLFITSGKTPPTERHYADAKELTYAQWLEKQSELHKVGEFVGIVVQDVRR